MLWTVDQQNRNKISLGFYYLILSLAIRRQVGDKFQSSEIKKGRILNVPKMQDFIQMVKT